MISGEEEIKGEVRERQWGGGWMGKEGGRFQRQRRLKRKDEWRWGVQEFGRKTQQKQSKKETKSILHRGEDSTETRTCFLSEKGWKKVRGTKTERTKGGKLELGGTERFHKKIRYGRRDSEEPQFHSGVSAAGLCCYGITRSASLDCALVLLWREPCTCFI